MSKKEESKVQDLHSWKSMEEMVEYLNKEGLNYIQFQFTNPQGLLRGMEERVNTAIHASKVGLGVDGSSVAGLAKINDSDVLLMADMSSAAIFDVDQTGNELAKRYSKIVRVMCSIFHRNLEPVVTDPRYILQKALNKARTMGFEPHTMSEVEFYLLTQDNQPADHSKYLALPPEDKSVIYRRQAGDVMINSGINVKRIHHEADFGQNEVEINLMPIMKTADDTLNVKWILEMLAEPYNWKVNVQPKLWNNRAGTGLHHHFRLYDAKTNQNVFGADDNKSLSKTGLQFTAGLLKYARAITAIFGRTPSTYRRLVPRFEAPVYVTWGYSNRSALVRIPAFKFAKDVKIEFRAGDYSGSPHLLAAALLMAGLKGIEEKLECPPDFAGDCDDLTDQELKDKGIGLLPRSLEESNEILKTDPFVKEVIGQELIDFFLGEYENVKAKDAQEMAPFLQKH